MSIAECPARRTSQMHAAIENPAQALVALQATVERQAQPPPAHGRHIRLCRTQLQMKPIRGTLSDPDRHLLQAGTRHVDRLGGQQHICPRRHDPADRQQQAATQQKMA